MPVFLTPSEAYEWAYEIRERYRAGSASDYDPDRTSSRGDKSFAILDALQIMILADRADVIDGRGSYFQAYFFPPPDQLERRPFNERERELLRGALYRFEIALAQKGYLRGKKP